MKHKIIIIVGTVTLSVLSCKSKIETISGYYNYDTACVSVEKNGVQTVKAWGFGLREKEAISNARKNAIDDILFKGIRDGKGGCNIRPIISNPNVKRDQERYFNVFYTPNGAFQSFASLPDENWLRQKLKINKKYGGNLVYEIILEVDIQGLKVQLQRDQIIP